jgi:predicted metal-dependent hydrolase
MIYELAYGAETIRYHVLWVPTRRTLGIEVHPDQHVLVRAPVGCTEDVIAARVKKRASWISRQIADFQRYSPRTPQRRYVSGETHLYLGKQYRLKVSAGDAAAVRMTRGQLIVTTPLKAGPDRVKAMLHRWYLDRARLVFGEVLHQCMPRFKGHAPPRLIVRTMQSRWGSLSPAGRMTLNANLIRAPRSCIEYVVTHELCHLRHRHHDTAFYRLLGQVMPDWGKRKRLLEEALI